MSEFEGFAIDALDVNDGVNFTLEKLKFVPAKKQPQWIDNPDADGAALAYEPNYTNGEFELRIRIEPQGTMDAALAKWAELQAKVQKASLMREQGGMAVVWTPAGSTRSYTGFALLGEISEFPIEVEGDDAGWFLNAPVITVKFTCRPFLRKEWRQLVAPTASGEVPIQALDLKGVGGDVPAEGELILTEKSAIDRRHLEWGLDQFSGNVLVTATGFTTAGFTGAVATRAGAYSAEKVVRGVAVAAWSPMCSVPITSLGSYRLKARVYVTSSAARFRASYRVGDGTFKFLDGVAPLFVGQYVEIDLGEATFEEVAKGAQRADVRIEAMSSGGVTEVDVNYLELLPTTSGYGKARGVQSNQATQLLAYDDYNQSAGNLDAPKALPLGGNWAEANRTGASGFQINEAAHVAQRTALSDADLNSGCYALAGATNYTTVQVNLAKLTATEYSDNEKYRGGLLLRYVDINNWLFVGWQGKREGLLIAPRFLVVQRVAGTISTLESLSMAAHFNAISPVGGGIGLSAIAASDGSWAATMTADGAQTEVDGQAAVLATGGALASGRVGIYDAWTGSTANTRQFDGFSLFAAAEAGRVCFASKKAEVRWDETERQDATGTYWGPPSSYRGSRFYVPVGDSRLAVKLRPNDVDVEPDPTVTLKHEVEVRIAERVLAPQ